MAKRRPDPSADKTLYFLVRPDGDVPIDFEATVAAYERTMRYAVSKRRPSVEPLLALLDEIEPALVNKFTTPQCVPAHDSLWRLRDGLTRVKLQGEMDDNDILILLILADAFRMFSPFLDGQPFQQALAAVLTEPDRRAARTKGSATRSEDADEEHRAVLKWAESHRTVTTRRLSATAEANVLAKKVTLQQDGTYAEPFTTFGQRSARAHHAPTPQAVDASKRTRALVRYLAGHLTADRKKQA